VPALAQNERRLESKALAPASASGAVRRAGIISLIPIYERGSPMSAHAVAKPGPNLPYSQIDIVRNQALALRDVLSSLLRSFAPGGLM
jgi:hypothetical protein